MIPMVEKFIKKADNNFLLQTKSLVLIQGKKHLIDIPDININPGECHVILGLNGVGKSTLLKDIMTLHHHYKGEIIRLHPPHKLCAYLPEIFQISPAITGKDFINLFKKEYNLKVMAFLQEKLNLSAPILSMPLRKYSKGMIQKLGLLHFFCFNRPLKIADEIMSGLDEKTRPLVIDEIHRQCEKGISFLITTHHRSDISHLSHQLIEIR